MVTLVGIWKVCISRPFPYPLSSHVIIARRRVQLHGHCDGWVSFSFSFPFALLVFCSFAFCFTLPCLALPALRCYALVDTTGGLSTRPVAWKRGFESEWVWAL